MKCILLVAGYATRLYPLTKNQPKALLPVAGKKILEYIVEKVEQVEEINEIILVSNHIFYQHFMEWKQSYQSNKSIIVIDDETTTNDNRLGAIADLQLAIKDQKINEDIIVLAGDNLFDFSLKDFVAFFNKVNADCITVNELKDIEALKRTGVVEINDERIAIGFEEKPQEPKSNLAVPPFYIYKKSTLPLISQYLEQGNNPDAPGNFVPWLVQRNKVYTYQFEGKRYDIGTHESYQEVNELFSK